MRDLGTIDAIEVVIVELALVLPFCAFALQRSLLLGNVGQVSRISRSVNDHLQLIMPQSVSVLWRFEALAVILIRK